jgi:TRAP-type C4-dicarboxylate transport system permease large subunit
MLRKWISCLLAGLIIVAAVTMFVREPRKAIGVAAAFCLVVGVLWLYDALRGLWHDQ